MIHVDPNWAEQIYSGYFVVNMQKGIIGLGEITGQCYRVKTSKKKKRNQDTKVPGTGAQILGEGQEG